MIIQIESGLNLLIQSVQEICRYLHRFSLRNLQVLIKINELLISTYSIPIGTDL